MKPAVPCQYRYDQDTVTALLAVQPPEPKTPAPASKHTGRKIAGLAFAGAVLVGGWALVSAHTHPAGQPLATGPVPAKAPDAPPAMTNAGTLQTIGVQSAALMTASAPPPAVQAPPAEKAPDQGSFSGTLPVTSSATTSAPAPAPKPQPTRTQPAPNWSSYYHDFAKYSNTAHGGGNNNHHDKHRGR